LNPGHYFPVLNIDIIIDTNFCDGDHKTEEKSVRYIKEGGLLNDGNSGALAWSAIDGNRYKTILTTSFCGFESIHL